MSNVKAIRAQTAGETNDQSYQSKSSETKENKATLSLQHKGLLKRTSFKELHKNSNVNEYNMNETRMLIETLVTPAKETQRQRCKKRTNANGILEIMKKRQQIISRNGNEYRIDSTEIKKKTI